MAIIDELTTDDANAEAGSEGAASAPDQQG